ncbi:MAG: Gfo/Idh/MocA family protein [Burkholderiales bacterium]
MSERRLKVAVVGASISNSPDGRERFAIRAHIPALKALPEQYELVAACTTRMESASATAERFGIPHAFDGVERMLRELPDLDVVCVCVRPNTHHSVVMPALRAGKHVYCEHPLGISTAQAQEAYELALEKGVHTAVGHQMHYQPAVLEMAQRVREGYIGRPLAFNISYITSSYIAPRPSHRQWLFTGEAGAHPAYRTGHNLERLTSVLGVDVAEVCADMAVLVPERPNLDGGAPIRNTQVDNVNLLLRMQEGAMGTMQMCLTAWNGPGWGFQLYGTEGMLMLRVADAGEKNTVKGDPNSGELRLYGAHTDIQALAAKAMAPELLQRQFSEITPREHHYYVSGIDRGRATFEVAQQWHAFARAIRSGSEFAPGFRDQLKMHYVWDATEKSIADRRWVKVDYGALPKARSA